MFSETFSSVQDQDGRIFVLNEELSSGGQGTVYKTQTRTDLVKLLHSGADAAETIARVRRMPLSKLPVARPISLLKDANGYTLQFQRDMDVVRCLKFSHNQSPYDWWVDTGGLVRRLWLSARIASVFELLHARGLVYGDISSRNIMVSTDSLYDEVSLIDLDNLSFTGGLEASEVWTPWYSAPEIEAEGQPPSFKSDDFSLGVVLFELLTSVHPFMDGAKAKQAKESSAYRELALRNSVNSVIDDNTDNPCHAYPVQTLDELIDDKLIHLFKQSLCGGRKIPSNRTSAGKFRIGLVRSALSGIECDKCHWTYSTKIHPRCPDCSQSSQIVNVTVSVQGIQTPVVDIQIGTKPKSVDLALIFPKLLKSELVRGSFRVELQNVNQKVRILPTNQDLIDVSRTVSHKEVMRVKGLGDLFVEATD